MPYEDGQLQEAIQMVASGRVTILKAANICRVPKSTLYLRLKEMGINSSVVSRHNWSAR
jgi:DNA-binding NtrC family response regulator